jgi:hypothetical protein
MKLAAVHLPGPRPVVGWGASPCHTLTRYAPAPRSVQPKILHAPRGLLPSSAVPRGLLPSAAVAGSGASEIEIIEWDIVEYEVTSGALTTVAATSALDGSKHGLARVARVSTPGKTKNGLCRSPCHANLKRLP